jgi:hypothetical protein
VFECLRLGYLTRKCKTKLDRTALKGRSPKKRFNIRAASWKASNRYGVRFVIGRVLFMLPIRVFVFILELDIKFPRDELLMVELLIVEFEYEFEFDIVLLDIVDEPPYEFEPLIELLFI